MLALLVARAEAALDLAAPPAGGLHGEVVAYRVDGGALPASLSLSRGGEVGLVDPARFVADASDPGDPEAILLRNNGLHIEIRLDRTSRLGRDDPAGVADIIAAVDAEDKTLVYRNWLGLMRGDLKASFDKGGADIERALSPDRISIGRNGEELVLPGRALLLIRNVGHPICTDAVLDAAGRPIPETILDAAVTAMIALLDLRGKGAYPITEAKTRSKPWTRRTLRWFKCLRRHRRRRSG